MTYRWTRRDRYWAVWITDHDETIIGAFLVQKMSMERFKQTSRPHASLVWLGVVFRVLALDGTFWKFLVFLSKIPAIRDKWFRYLPYFGYWLISIKLWLFLKIKVWLLIVHVEFYECSRIFLILNSNLLEKYSITWLYQKPFLNFPSLSVYIKFLLSSFTLNIDFIDPYTLFTFLSIYLWL